MPLIAHNLLQSIDLLGNAAQTFSRRCVVGLEAQRDRCSLNIEQSLANSTSLAPVLGYDKAAEIAKAAYETNRTVRAVAVEQSGLDKATLEQLLAPAKQTHPG